MVNRDELKDLLKKQLTIHEARVATPYQDTVGKWTWGVGRNLDDVGLSKEEILCLLSKGKEAAMDLCLSNDIERVYKDLDTYLHGWDTHGQPRAGVLANMCFNLGIRGLLAFTNTLRLYQAGDYEGTARAMYASKWNRQVGRRATTLRYIMKYDEWIEGYLTKEQEDKLDGNSL